MIRICTGFSPEGYKQYGMRFLETFNTYWSKDIDLVVYTEEPLAPFRGQCRSLWDCTGAADFYWRNKDIPEHCGRAPTPSWKRKEFNAMYSWRQDGVKFFKQCMIPEDSAKDLVDGDILIWSDADVVFFAPPPKDFPGYLLSGFDLLHLGRGPNSHSEIGFWAVKIGSSIREFLFNLAEIYRSEDIFKRTQFHSAFAFDICRKEMERRGMKSRNIVPEGLQGHVWFDCVLGTFSDHLKGNRRKRLGFSPERKMAR